MAIKFYISITSGKWSTAFSAAMYDKIEVYDWKVVGWRNGGVARIWYFEDYKQVAFVPAQARTQFGQIVFLEKNDDLKFNKNKDILADARNRIICCNGLWSWKDTNDFVKEIYDCVKEKFYAFRDAKAQHYLNNDSRDE